MNKENINMNQLKKVYILWPGGNTTALVKDKIPRQLQPVIARKIMKVKPKVEQVGFIEKPENKKALARLQMMGGEFCGNSTRCLGWLLLKGKPGRIKLEVSGSKKLLDVKVNQKGDIKTEMPIKPTLSSIQKTKDKYWVVSLCGITHVVVEERLIPEKANRQKLASKILDKLGLKRLKAAGVLFIRKEGSKIFMDPFVWVRNVGTFFNETACASGSTAVSLVKSLKTGKSIKSLEIVQPSRSSIFVFIKRDTKNFLRAWIGGPVVMKYEGKLKI